MEITENREEYTKDQIISYGKVKIQFVKFESHTLYFAQFHISYYNNNNFTKLFFQFSF